MSTPDNSVLRALLLMQLLSSTKGSTAREIFDEIPAYSGNLQVLERDIQIFGEVGFKLEKNFVGTKAKPQVSYRIDPARRPGLLGLPGQQDEELLRLALLLAQNPAGPPLPLRDILRTLAIHEMQVSLGTGNSKIKDYNKTITKILDAISTSKQVQTDNTARLDPLYLAFLDMKLVLLCWDHTHHAYEEIGVEEIKKCLFLMKRVKSIIPQAYDFW